MPKHLIKFCLTWLAAILAGPAAAQTEDAVRLAIEAVGYDYIDGQLDGDVARVERALHPDLAKRTPKKESAYELLPLARMTTDELVDLTRKGALKTPHDQWQRSVALLSVDGDIATVRVETKWFVDHLQMAKFGDRWVIVNAIWHRKPRPVQP